MYKKVSMCLRQFATVLTATGILIALTLASVSTKRYVILKVKYSTISLIITR